MARKTKKAKKTKKISSPGWMTTYSDLMSLLLTFFILLFSMSVMNEARFKEVAESLRTALIGNSSDAILDSRGETIGEELLDDYGDLGEWDDTNPDDSVVEEAPATQNLIPEEVQELFQTVTDYLEEEGLEADISITRDHEGVYIDIQEAILFDSGSATLKPNGSETIGSLAGLFNSFNNEIIIEGYTDDIPMNTRDFPSNWELSVGRAVSVLRYLSEEYSIDPARLSARGYGEHRPIVPNDSEENRAQNRRVNIVIVHEDGEEETNGSE